MKTAYFIAVHHKLPQFRWLFEAIYSPDDVYCIHVDRKSPASFRSAVADYVGRRKNVFWLPSRSIAWAGWSMVVAELDAMKYMLSQDADWNYFVNLSGQDYPAKPMAEIKDTLRREWPRNFIRAWTFDKIAKSEPNDPHLRQKFCFECRGKLRQTRLTVRLPDSPDLRFKGSAWHMLTREFCGWIQTAAVTRQAKRSLWHTFCPDEVFFQGVIMNSPFADLRTADSGRFVLWPGPKTLLDSDFEAIASSDCQFARKFDEAVDRAVLERLACFGGYQTPEHIGASTLIAAVSG